jgi:hypothetical protein
MNIKAAKQLFEEIVELCYESNNPRLIETVDGIYPEVKEADDLSKIISSLEELQVAINETDILPEEEECVQEVQEKIELLSE